LFSLIKTKQNKIFKILILIVTVIVNNNNFFEIIKIEIIWININIYIKKKIERLYINFILCFFYTFNFIFFNIFISKIKVVDNVKGFEKLKNLEDL